MISLNYLIQLAVIPNALKYPTVIELFATANANSLFWYIEMTGYGFLGLATWAGGMLFGGNPRKKAIRYLFVANGISSVLGTVLTFIFKGWVMSPAGLVSYLLWNVLVLIVMILVLVEYKSGKALKPNR